MIILSVLFGLGAAFGFGVGDFFGAKAAKKIGALSTAFLTQLYSLILFSLAIGFLGFNIDIPLWTIALGVVTGFLFGVSFWSFFKALDIGPVAVTNPIANSYSLIAVLIGVVFLAERLSFQHWTGIAIIFLGIFFGSSEFENLRLKFKNKMGVMFALFAMFGWGLAFAMYDIIIEEIGWAMGMLLIELFTAMWLGVFSYKALKIKQIFSWNKNVVLMAVLGFFGFIAISMGLERGLVSVVTPIASISPLFTASLAIILLKERLSKLQYFGTALIIVGLVVLAI